MKARWLAAALMLGTAAAPAVAQVENDAERWKAMSEQELAGILADFLAHPMSEPCINGIPAALEASRRHPDIERLRLPLEIARMFCAVVSERPAEALDHYLALESLEADLPPYLGLIVATNANDVDQVLRQIRRELLDSDAPIAGENADRIMQIAFREVSMADREDDLGTIALEAVAAGRLGTTGDRSRGWLAFAALKPAMTRMPDQVPVLLAALGEPPRYVELLASREYSLIWPQIEVRVGPHMRAVVQEQLATRRAIFDADPASSLALMNLTYALFDAGKYSEVIDLVGQWRRSEDALAEIDENLAWAINIASYAHYNLGQQEEAFATLAEITGPTDTNGGWVVNFAINYATLLVGAGRWEEGLAASQRAREIPGSPYAEMLVARDHACALDRLGRRAEAEAELGFLREHAEVDYNIAGTALLCLGLREELTDMLTEALADDDTAAEYYTWIQTSNFDFFGTDSVFPSVAEFVMANPALRARIERVSRQIPDEFVPEIGVVHGVSGGALAE